MCRSCHSDRSSVSVECKDFAQPAEQDSDESGCQGFRLLCRHRTSAAGRCAGSAIDASSGINPRIVERRRGDDRRSVLDGILGFRARLPDFEHDSGVRDTRTHASQHGRGRAEERGARRDGDRPALRVRGNRFIARSGLCTFCRGARFLQSRSHFSFSTRRSSR
jgi:hypothetical protein